MVFTVQQDVSLKNAARMARSLDPSHFSKKGLFEYAEKRILGTE